METQSISILRLPEIMHATGLSRSSIYKHIDEGTFPKQISLGARAVGWVDSEIAGWIADKIRESRGRDSSPEARP
jgi:prophage regulatory protein